MTCVFGVNEEVDLEGEPRVDCCGCIQGHLVIGGHLCVLSCEVVCMNMSSTLGAEHIPSTM